MPEINPQQAIALIKQGKAQTEAMKEKEEELNEKKEEVEQSKKTVKNFPKTKKDTIVPLGEGFFLKTEMGEENPRFLVEVGAGVILRKNSEEALEVMEKREKEINDHIEELNKNIQQISQQTQKLRETLQKQMQQQQSQGQEEGELPITG